MADASIVPANSDLKLNTVISIAPSTITQQISNLNTNADKNGGDTLKQNDLTDKDIKCTQSLINTEENPEPVISVKNSSNTQQLAPATTNTVSQVLNKSSITIVPKINVLSGQQPVKRNVAVKNPSAGVLKQTQKLIETNRKIKKQSSSIKNRLSDEDPILTDKEDTSFEYNSNDEFIPRNTGSDGSDMEFDSIKRKSARLSKKPKILDEYVMTSCQEDSSSQFSQQQDTVDSSRVLTNETQQNSSNNRPQLKQFARKSTSFAALSHLSQNISINQQQKSKLINKATPQTTTIQANNASTPIGIGSTKYNPTASFNGTSFNKLSNSTKLIQSNQNNIISSSITGVQTTSTSPVNGKQYRNKIVSCKPFCESKGTECAPIVKDASTQIDLDEIKLSHTVVPVPVPIHVPLPMYMYQAALPMPIILPLPIPVPIFIPTTMKSYERIQKRIQKLRKKLPSDPYEFEILLYAEKLAREEGIPGFEESSDGESEPETTYATKRRKLKSDTVDTTPNQATESHISCGDINSINQKNPAQDQILAQKTNKNNFIQSERSQQQPIQQTEEGNFKWVYGVNLFNTWFTNKIEQLKSKNPNNLLKLPNDILKLKNEELNILLAEFVHEIRKPSGEIYAPESVYYLCLGLQYYLQEKGRVENIFLDSHLFDKFQDSLNDIALRYQIRINTDGQITSRIEEEILWESKQLGAHSPFVLLNTILYFNTKYFFLDKPQSHLQLSFTNVKKHSKRNIGPSGEDYGKTAFLRYYPDFHGLEQVIYEQGENYDNPLRCPVELYNFYLSKCPESVKNRSDLFYLLPEKASLPSSPVWFSSQPISTVLLSRMINRIKMVREVNELLLAASPGPVAGNLI